MAHHEPDDQPGTTQNESAAAPLCCLLEVGSRSFESPLEIIQPVILRLYLLLPVEEGLLELLVLRLCLFCAGDRGVCLSAKRGEFLFSNVSKVPGLS